MVSSLRVSQFFSGDCIKVMWGSYRDYGRLYRGYVRVRWVLYRYSCIRIKEVVGPLVLKTGFSVSG